MAVAAFNGIKAGVAAGKEISSLAKDIGKMFDAIDSVKQEHNNEKNKPFQSANEEALQTFINKKQAEDLEDNLRAIVIATRGPSAWQELIRMRVEVRKKRQEEEEARRRRRQELIEALGTWFLVIVIVVVIGGIGILGLAKYLGRI
jgi:hypothetical protein